MVGRLQHEISEGMAAMRSEPSLMIRYLIVSDIEAARAELLRRGVGQDCGDCWGLHA
jgi:hypothetical protein